jgi:ABC-2 type transport system permease protein
MNDRMIGRLIWKDWYLQRWVILASFVGGATALVIIAKGGKAGFLVGLILLITVLISIGAQLAVSTIVQERKDQTLTFAMSLPISYREYTASKMLGNLAIFLVVWLVMVLSSLALSVGSAHGTDTVHRHHGHGNSTKHLPGSGYGFDHRIAGMDDRGHHGR